MDAFTAPIPGQSLTDEPKNYPWERPPEISDHNEAIKYHIERIQDEDVIDNVLFALEYGFPVSVLSKAMMTGAVGKGIHTVDISLIIEPVITEYISRVAEKAGIDYVVSFEKEGADTMARAAALVNKAIRNTPEDEQDEGYDLLKETAATLESQAEEEPMEGEAMPMEEEMVAEEAAPKGLMARA